MIDKLGFVFTLVLASSGRCDGSSSPGDRNFRPSRGFASIEPAVVLTCHEPVVYAQDPLLHSRDELLAAVHLSDFGLHSITDACSGPLPEIDFNAGALVVVTLGHASNISFIGIREGELEVGITHTAYCGGPAPPGPSTMLLNVPASVTSVQLRHRDVGQCTGPPRP